MLAKSVKIKQSLFKYKKSAGGGFLSSFRELVRVFVEIIYSS